jgi:hypothetical protein
MLSSDNVLPVLLARRAEQQLDAPYVVNAETGAISTTWGRWSGSPAAEAPTPASVTQISDSLSEITVRTRRGKTPSHTNQQQPRLSPESPRRGNVRCAHLTRK